MAKILVSGPCAIFDKGEFQFAVFYDGFIKALLRCGNDVKAINSSAFLKKPWNGENHLSSFIDADRLTEEVKNFAPDLIIAFNHSIPREALDNTNCPVIVWDADSLQFYNDKEYLRENMDRYFFFCFSKAGVQNALTFGAPEEKVHLVYAGTAIEAEDIPQDKNISFIGTNFTVPYEFVKMLRDKGSSSVKPIAEELAKNYYADQDEIIRKYGADWVNDYMDVPTLASIKSTQVRNSLLNDLHPLGLTIYGPPGWHDVGTQLPWLAMCYNDTRVYSLKHNQDIYNSSKLCINVSHAHTVDGFPWRVMDIMASKGCLVSDYKPGLAELTKGYVDLPMYEDRREAYELCKKLLKDDVWRKDIVAGSQACMKDHGSWTDRIAEVGRIIGINTVPAATPRDIEEIIYRNSILNQKTYFKQKAQLLFKSVASAAKMLPKPILKFGLKLCVLFNIPVSAFLIDHAHHAKVSRGKT
jgi:hypothetical protein